MRYIDLTIIDTNEAEVKKWISKANNKLSALSSLSTHKERKEFLQKNDIWKDFKQILKNKFGDNCWYSECSLAGDFGAVDHFRPKNCSKDEQGNIILPNGYWWLAYDYLNYRISCDKCNTSFDGGGKQDFFPLKPGTLPASNPNKNDLPMLLDPCVEQDVQLIDCDEQGEIVALCQDPYDRKRVDISKKIYNWKCFNNARKKIRNDCKIALELFEKMYESFPNDLELSLTQLTNLVNDKTPYSSFAKKYIRNWIEDKPYASIFEKTILL